MTSKPACAASPIKIGYVSRWAMNSAHLRDPLIGQTLTHLIYAFVDVSSSGTCEGSAKELRQFQSIKAQHPTIKSLFSIGGWGGSGTFSDIALNEASRKRFVQSCVSLMRRYHFDGMDVDWEYPVTGGLKTDSHRPEDRKNFVLLLQEFRRQLGPKPLLAVAVSGKMEHLPDLDIKAMSRFLNWIGLMTYDFCDDIACHPSDWALGKVAVQWAIAQGVPKSKIVYGLPFYGHRWHVKSLENNGIGQEIDHTRDEPAYSFADIKRRFYSDSEKLWIGSTQSPLLLLRSENVLIAYENAHSLKIKAEEVSKMNLGGWMVWELSHDTRSHELLKAFRSVH